MNLTKIIYIKERIAISSEWTPAERDFILECINAAVADTASRDRERLSQIDFILADGWPNDSAATPTSEPITDAERQLLVVLVMKAFVEIRDDAEMLPQIAELEKLLRKISGVDKRVVMS